MSHGFSLLVIFLVFFSPQVGLADPFWWGAGHAAFQVEGTPGDSDWNRWAHTKGKILNGDNADHATEFWKDPEKDFDLVQKLGAKMFRFSIAWERIEPVQGKWDEAALERYEKMIVSLRKRGIEPLITLHHFVLPGWLAEKGGTTTPEFAEDFARYAVKVVSRLAKAPANVQWWMTFNEPMVLVYAGYLTGEFPPGFKDRQDLAVQSAAGLARAHIKAMQGIRELNLPNAKFSIAAHWRDFQGRSNWPVNYLLGRLADWCFNRQFMSSITTGNIFFWMPGGNAVNDHLAIPKSGTLDYLGVNYYGRKVISFRWSSPFVQVDEGDGPKTDIDWEIYPEGLGRILPDIYKSYHLPILISENGIADAKDLKRADFLKSHIEQIRMVKEQGVPVIGYLHWALTDNFEWAAGFAPRFGLVEMDYATGERKPRPSFAAYREMIRQSGF